MPYADMLYGYDIETAGIEGNSNPTLLPQVVQWLRAAPAPFRPLTVTTSDLQAIALVQESPTIVAYIAVWNVSATGASYTTSIELANLNGDLAGLNLKILQGSGSTISELSNTGITVSGNIISGLAVAANEFLLLSLQ